MLGIAGAGHTENDPDAAVPLIVQVACAVPDRADGAPLLSGTVRIRLVPGSRAAMALGVPAVEEEFTCNYELNPAFRAAFEAAGMTVAGVSDADEVRIVELAGHPFFVGTLFQPQLNSRPDAPHPLVLAYLDAALASRAARGTAAATT